MNHRTESDLLFSRANKVIPTGIYGHVSPSADCPWNSLIIACPEKDVDLPMWMEGSGWILCGFGAILHGYRNPFIEESVEKQRKLGSVFNQPSKLMVDLAEKLAAQIDFANWAVLQKMDLI